MTALGWAVALIITVWSAYELWHRGREHRAELGGYRAGTAEATTEIHQIRADNRQLRADLAAARAEIALGHTVLNGKLIRIAEQQVRIAEKEATNDLVTGLLDEVQRRRRPEQVVVTRIRPDAGAELESAPEVYIGEITGEYPAPAVEARS